MTRTFSQPMTSTTILTSKLTTSFVVAFIVTTILLVYVLHAPQIITQDATIFDEYYYNNAVTTLSGDFFAGVLLLLAAQYIIYLTNITGNLSRIGIVAIVVALASALRQIVIRSNDSETEPATKRWYSTVDTHNSVVYDVIFMTTLYIVLTTIYSQFI